MRSRSSFTDQPTELLNTSRAEVQESWRERTIDSKLLCCSGQVQLSLGSIATLQQRSGQEKCTLMFSEFKPMEPHSKQPPALC
jgi:hypothetical protein